MGSTLFLCAVLLLAALTGCGPGETPRQKAEKYKARAEAALAEARAAEAVVEVAQASRAADRAQEAVGDLEKLAAKHAELAAELTPLLQATRLTVAEARRVVERTRERVQLADKLKTLKARAYRAATVKILPPSFESLAAAADTVGASDQEDSLPPGVRETAALATNLTRFLPGRHAITATNGTSIWFQVAADLRGASKDLRTVHLLLATGWVLASYNDFALFEIEQIGSQYGRSPVQEKESKILYQALRTILLAQAGLPRLSLLEADYLSATLKTNQLASAEVEMGARLVVFFYTLRAGELDLADTQLKEIIRTQPNHPLVVYLTGEKLLADGQREKAADSMETFAGSVSDPAMAERVMKRVRDIRDGRPSASLLTDDQFMKAVFLYYFKSAAIDSAPARRVTEWLDTVKKFGSSILDKLLTPADPTLEMGRSNRMVI
ncbi:MAG: hypothetical protein WCO56_02720 [Verrucomicrobiota bacterium]